MKIITRCTTNIKSDTIILAQNASILAGTITILKHNNVAALLTIERMRNIMKTLECNLTVVARILNEDRPDRVKLRRLDEDDTKKLV